MGPRTPVSRGTRCAAVRSAAAGLCAHLFGLVGTDRVQILARPQVVDVQRAAEVVGLVEHALRPELLALDGEPLPVEVRRGEARCERALQHPVEAADREAAL